MNSSHYDILQVTRNASEPVIRAAYRTLASKYHPDKSMVSPQEADRMMKLLNEAYAILSDLERRKDYDSRLIADELKQQGPPANTIRPEEQRSATEFPKTQSPVNPKWPNEILLVKPKRYWTIAGCMFGISMIYFGFDTIENPSTAKYEMQFASLALIIRIGNKIWGLFTIAFGTACTVWYGGFSLSNKILSADSAGITFSVSRKTRLAWSEITDFETDKKSLILAGRSNGKKWRKEFPRWLISGNCDEIVKNIAAYKSAVTK